MDIGRIITRSFEITRKYRALWIFGILLAIFGSSGGGGSGGNVNFNLGDFNRGRTPFDQALPGFPGFPKIPYETILAIIGVVICIVLLWIILSIIIRLVSRGALIGLVNELEANQVQPRVKRGFDTGVDRFMSLLGIALIINVPLTLISILLVLGALLPLFASLVPMISTGRPPEQFTSAFVPGLLSSIALICCVAGVLIVVQLVLQPFYQFFMRAAVIGKRGARDAIREGYRLVRANAGNTVFLYIIMIGFAIVYGIVMFVLILALVAAIAAAAIGVGAASQSTTNGIIVGVVLGIPALIALLFVSGLYQVFDSTMWTEGYLAISAAPTATTEPAPSPAPAA